MKRAKTHDIIIANSLGMCNCREGEKVGRANRTEKTALVLTAAFFLICAGRFWVLHGSDADFQVRTTKQEQSVVSQQSQTEWPVSLLPGECIDINTAPVADLARLPQIGEKRAQAIVAWREEKGPFQNTEQLMEVSGIGEGIYGQISGYITVSSTD